MHLQSLQTLNVKVTNQFISYGTFIRLLQFSTMHYMSTSDLNISQSGRTESERPDKVSVSNLPKSGGKCSNEEDDMLELPPLSPVDIHREHHFSKLLLSWDGAPEFQWKSRRFFCFVNAFASQAHL